MERVCFEITFVVDSVRVGELSISLFEVVAQHPFETRVVVIGLHGKDAVLGGLYALKCRAF